MDTSDSYLLLRYSLPRRGPRTRLRFWTALCGFAEDAFKATQHAPDGPPPFRIGLMLPQSGQMREAGERIAR